jgi:Fe2+ transport system protein FeoA
MKLVEGKVYQVLDVPQSEICQKCVPCLRLKMMEMGFICGEKILLKKHSFGIWVVSILSESGHECSTIALRDDEIKRIVLEEIKV